MTPKWESRKTPLEGGRKSMQGERRTQYQHRNNILRYGSPHVDILTT